MNRTAQSSKKQILIYLLAFSSFCSKHVSANDLIPAKIAGLDLQEIINSPSPIYTKEDIQSAFDLPFYEAFHLKGHSQPLKTCRDVLRAQGSTKHYLQPQTSPETSVLSDITGTCIAARFNLNAQPSEISFIPDSPIDRDILDTAPYALGLNSNYNEMKIFLTEHPMATWAESNIVIGLDQHDQNNATLRLQGAMQHIRVVGRGDMNGDGFEDIILKITSTIDPPSNYLSNSLWVLTKMQFGGRYTILESYDGFRGRP
jgi:hypothetical protein